MAWDGDGFRAMLNRLDQVRKSMAGAKNTKLMMRWADYGDYRNFEVGDVIDHLDLEIEELRVALARLGPTDIRDEVLDVANCLEFLWDVLGLARA